MKYEGKTISSEFDIIAKKIMELLPGNMNGKLLDLGCNDGLLSNYLPEKVEYVGLDCDRHFKNQIVCDLNDKKLPFKDNEFDYIVASNILEHLFYPEEILKEMKRVLKPSGMAVILLPLSTSLAYLYAIFIGRQQDSIEKQKYEHHWLYYVDNSKEFIGKHFKIKKIDYWNGKLWKFNFILKHFPSLCSGICLLCINEK